MWELKQMFRRSLSIRIPPPSTPAVIKGKALVRNAACSSSVNLQSIAFIWITSRSLFEDVYHIYKLLLWLVAWDWKLLCCSWCCAVFFPNNAVIYGVGHFTSTSRSLRTIKSLIYWMMSLLACKCRNLLNVREAKISFSSQGLKK